jgi:BUD22
VDRHIKKILMKVKSISSSQRLPQSLIEQSFPQWDHATVTVASRLYNTKQVKEAMDLLVESVRKEIAKKAPASHSGHEEHPVAAKTESGQKQRKNIHVNGSVDSNLSATEKAVSESTDIVLPSSPGANRHEEIAELLGSEADSDKNEDEDEETDKLAGLEDNQRSKLKETQHNPPRKSLVRDISLSPSPEPSFSEESEAVASSNRAAKGSTFLPSLTGAGYVSGSESEASDINDEIAPRKNRRGQQARRLIAERKYGANAKHLQKVKKGKAGRDQGWDARRGAVSNERTNSRPTMHVERHPTNSLDHDKTRDPLEKIRKNDDSGPLHPSWAARKQAKAKEKISIQQFSGKKIVFD